MRRMTPEKLGGEVRMMPSKSASHRALICAALAAGHSEVAPLMPSMDIRATIAAISGMGLAKIEQISCADETGTMACRVTGGLRGGGERVAPCGESGSTLRFLMPLALDGRGPVRFTGEGRLLERPLDPYRVPFAAQGIRWDETPDGITLAGTLTPGDYALPGDVSSQFVTGLLYALPALNGDSTIRLTPPVESRGYIDLTIEALAAAGVIAHWREDSTLTIPGNQTYRAGRFFVEGDWSHAAFFLVAGVLGGGVRLTGLKPDSRQGDRAIVDILRDMGGDIIWEGGTLVARPSALTGAEIDCAQVPDLVPALVAAAVSARGRTVLTGAARLRMKESDRLAALEQEFGALGANITSTADGLLVHGGHPLTGGRADSHNDHRIAMAIAIAAANGVEPTILIGDEAVRKSAPDFWREYESIGGCARCEDNGEKNWA